MYILTNNHIRVTDHTHLKLSNEFYVPHFSSLQLIISSNGLSNETETLKNEKAWEEGIRIK